PSAARSTRSPASPITALLPAMCAPSSARMRCGFCAMLDLDVNGARHSIEVHGDTPLLYVLRNDFGLVGTRFGCGSGQCGACFVMVEGKPIASCDLPLSFVAGKSVTTVEGLSGKVQKALIAEQAAQCGYCMSGIIISATAL